MKAAPFNYHRPESLAAAVAMLSELDNARPLAGGQSLMAMINMRYVQVDHLVDLNRIAELSGIRVNGDGLEIGAMVRQHVLLEHREVAAHSPLIPAALAHVGHIQTRARGTIGGSLCHLDPAAELPACLLALDAELLLAGPEGERIVPIENWFMSYMTPDLKAGELLAAIRVPRPTAGLRHCFMEVAQRKGDFAIASTACLLSLSEGRIARATIVVAGLGVRPERVTGAELALAGQAPSDALLASAADPVEALEVVPDSYFDASYKRSLAKTLMRRSLKQVLGFDGGSA